MSLAEARAVAFENRKLARARSDPLAKKHQTKPGEAMATFREAAEVLRGIPRDACPLICETIFWPGPKMPGEQVSIEP